MQRHYEIVTIYIKKSVFKVETDCSCRIRGEGWESYWKHFKLLYLDFLKRMPSFRALQQEGLAQDIFRSTTW